MARMAVAGRRLLGGCADMDKKRIVPGAAIEAAVGGLLMDTPVDTIER
jgi:hypothetical protein